MVAAFGFGKVDRRQIRYDGGIELEESRRPIAPTLLCEDADHPANARFILGRRSLLLAAT
jgi:hypothetical protein